MSQPAMNGHADPAGVFTGTETGAMPGAIPEETPGESQRVGVHGGAGVRGRARGRARAREGSPRDARKGSRRKDLTTALSHDSSHGAPWQERPSSLTELREIIHKKAGQHTAVPGARQAYITFGYGVALPVSAVFYGVVWVCQAPGRLTVAGTAWIILRVTGLLPAIPLHLISQFLHIVL